MTASLPSDVQAVFNRFITTELTTVDGPGQPITWPVTPYYRPGDSCIDVTTGLGLPKKANDAQVNPLVSMLFSDPTGSGLNDPPMVLVQGSAEVDDRNLDAERVSCGVWHPRMNELGARFSTAVVAIVSPDGFPFAMRAPVHADESGRCIRIDAPVEGAPLQPGLACLTAHLHEPGLSWMENFQVRGDLVQDEDTWRLVPHRLVGGFEAPASQLAMLRANAGKALRFRRTAKRELARRS